MYVYADFLQILKRATDEFLASFSQLSLKLALKIKEKQIF